MRARVRGLTLEKVSPLVLRLLPLLVAFLLAGCVVTGKQDRFLAKYADAKPTVSAMTVCHGYGCRVTEEVSLAREWDDLTADFQTPAETPEQERERIAALIADVEIIVGEKLGTAEDIGGTFTGFGQDGQQDCIDETTNTTTILTLLENEGLLAWHDVRAPMSRGFFINGWPHTSAVIAETNSEQHYVVDSWFHDNGQPAEVVTLETWVGGWSPEGSTAEQIVVITTEPAHNLSPPRAP